MPISIDKFSQVDVIAHVEFNGLGYYVIRHEENFGYIPDTFLIKTILNTDSQTTVTNAYVYKKGGVEVFDSSGNLIGVIQKKSKVTILAYGDKLTISYNNGIGYIDSDVLVLNSKSEILKTIAVFLAALSICVTALFFEKKFLLNKN
jgi:hypothetical protein